MDKATRDGLKTIVQTNIENMQDIVNSAFIKELISDCERLEHELTEIKKKHSASPNANTVLGDVRPFWRTGLPDKNGRYLVVYRQHKQKNIFVMDFDEIEHRWQSLLPDVEILLWAEIPPYVT